MKSTLEGSFYLPTDAPERVVPTPATAGPWTPDAQHAGPPSGLLARALEAVLEHGQVLARISVDLLGPVPLGPLSVTTTVVRPGRTVSLLEATLYDDRGGRACATARAWVLPRSGDGPGSPTPLPHVPADGVQTPLPPSWNRGYVDHVEWRWIKGAVLEAGAATVWMRPRVPLLPGEPLSGITMLMTCVDSANGVSAALDPAEWLFLNTDLTVHLLREPVGDWVCVDAETTLGPSAAGFVTARVYDERGVVAQSMQALLVVPRRSL
jgi:hypothetical protein